MNVAVRLPNRTMRTKIIRTVSTPKQTMSIHSIPVSTPKQTMSIHSMPVSTLKQTMVTMTIPVVKNEIPDLLNVITLIYQLIK